MKRESVDFAGGTLELDLDPDRVVACWSGPHGRSGIEVSAEVRQRLESPIGFPPLARAVVPGDRVVLAADGGLPEGASILATVVNMLDSSGVERGDILVLGTASSASSWAAELPAGVRLGIHDPAARESLSYLATTAGGRRIYLNREVVEADFVLPIGCLVSDPVLGLGGPWSTLFPGMADMEARGRAASSADRESEALCESAEVSWLLGNQLQMAVLPGVSGVAEVLAGAGEPLLEAGRERLRASWTLRVDRRAEVVVVGVGPELGVEPLWRAFATGASLARRGGKVVALCSASGPLGPAARRLAGADRPGPATLRGAELEADYPAARGLAEALAWADLYLFSALDPDLVEDLGIMPLAKPAEARRLAQSASEIALINRAEWTRVEVREEGA